MAVWDAPFFHDEVAKAFYEDVAIAVAAVFGEYFKHSNCLFMVLSNETNHASVHVAAPHLAGGYALLSVVESFRGVLHDGVVVPNVTGIGKGGLTELQVLVVDFKRFSSRESPDNAWFFAC